MQEAPKRVVVSDTSPIRYLVLMQLEVLLERLYGRVLIPQAVAAELQRPRTPQAVQAWMDGPPPWIEVLPSRLETLTHTISTALDPGEQAALQLALQVQADLVLIDERAGAVEAVSYTH